MASRVSRQLVIGALLVSAASATIGGCGCAAVDDANERREVMVSRIEAVQVAVRDGDCAQARTAVATLDHALETWPQTESRDTALAGDAVAARARYVQRCARQATENGGPASAPATTTPTTTSTTPAATTPGATTTTTTTTTAPQPTTTETVQAEPPTTTEPATPAEPAPEDGGEG